MEIREISIDKITPDANQPRKSFSTDRIKEMAQSIVTEGVINPIEVDKNNTIITGEMRWRAAKSAGLKTVPCKVLDLSGDERFMRQVIENIHHNTMTSWDTAQSLSKLLGIIKMSPGDISSVKHGLEDKGITKLALKIGKSRSYISEYLSLLDASKSFQKAVKEGLNHTMIRAIRVVPEEYKDAIETKIVSKELSSRDGAQTLATAIKQNPTVAKKLLQQDYSNCQDLDSIKSKIRKVVPDFTEHPVSDAFKDGCEVPDQIGKVTLDLIKLLRENPADSVGKIHLKRVISSLIIAQRAIEKWMESKEIGNHKVLEIK